MREAARLAAAATGTALIAVILGLGLIGAAISITLRDEGLALPLTSILVSTAACGGVGLVLSVLQ